MTHEILKNRTLALFFSLGVSLKTWHDLGCYHIQFNVIDRNVLLDAQLHPEKYPDLVVRVAGYSAYWADLGKSLQDDIIQRTEQSLC